MVGACRGPTILKDLPIAMAYPTLSFYGPPAETDYSLLFYGGAQI